MSQLEHIAKLTEIASSQWGLFTTAQAKRVGVERVQLSRLADRKMIERHAFGVYRISGAPASRFVDIQVAWLSTDPNKLAEERLAERQNSVVVGGHTAAYLYDAGSLWPTPYLFITPIRRQTQRPEIVFRKRDLAERDIVVIDGIPVTSPEYTIAMLAAEGEDASHIAEVVYAMSKTHTVDKDYLEQLVSPYAKRYGYQNRDGKAFVQYLFQGATLSIAKSFAESFQESVEALIGSPVMERLSRALNVIPEYVEQASQNLPTGRSLSTPVLEAFSAQLEGINAIVGESAFKASQELLDTIQKLSESPSYQIALFQHEQFERIKELVDSPAFTAVPVQTEALRQIADSVSKIAATPSFKVTVMDDDLIEEAD
jgi:predicted transcriptional regulator of viral defense system